jgi:hypothetical protein
MRIAAWVIGVTTLVMAMVGFVVALFAAALEALITLAVTRRPKPVLDPYRQFELPRLTQLRDSGALPATSSRRRRNV